MKKLLFSVAMLAFVAVSCNKNDEGASENLTKEPMTIGVSASGLDVSYNPLSLSSRASSGDLLAVQVYEGDTPVANGVVEDWTALTFEGYSNTTYTVVATMIVNAKNDIYEDAGTYGLPFNSEITANLVASSTELSALASSTAKLSSDNAEYTVPNIDRYYGTTTRTVTASSPSITTYMKRMSFGVKYEGTAYLDLKITGAPVITLAGGDTMLFSLTDFEAAYSADETTDAYSETIATQFNDSTTSYDVVYKRNQEVTITFLNGNFGFEFETGYENAKGIRVLTFEDVDYNAGANYVGLYNWSSLVDAEYGGTLLYGAGGSGVTIPYEWTDTNNTFLHNKILDSWGTGTFEFWNGGIAVSNYYAESASGLGSANQLSVPIKNDQTNGSGNNGSQNFAVVNADVYSQTSLYFADGVDRVVDHLYIANTSYASSTCLYGDGYSSKPFTTGNDFWVTLTGYDNLGEQTGTVKYYLATDGVLAEGWNKCDISSLGAVNRINFNIDSNVTNDYGSVVPSYIAIDDIAVLFE